MGKKRMHCIRGILFLFCALFFSGIICAQETIVVKGTVSDSLSTPMVGVNVLVEGDSKKGTATNEKGDFTIAVKTDDVLVFTSVGYEKELVPVNGQTSISVILRASAAHDESEVIVTAFGRKERKEAVVGSVVTVNPEQLRIPSGNLTNALAGRLPGLIAFQQSGQPGFDNSQFLVRGVTSLGYSNEPLILIDNMEMSANDMARMRVDDIESFTLLKDASASAVYGSRGANGVILITTKRGKDGPPLINLLFENSINKMISPVRLSDPVTYMKLYNEASNNDFNNNYLPYLPNKILNTQATMDKAPGSNPYVYPAVDWMSMLFRPRSDARRAHLSLRGGGPTATYYVSGYYGRENGILQVDKRNNFNSGMKFQNYQLRANVTLNVTKSTKAEVLLMGTFNDYMGPLTNSSDGYSTDLYSQALHTSPVDFPAYFWPDEANKFTNHILFGNTTRFSGLGSSGIGSTGTNVFTTNPYAQLMRGYKNFSESNMQAQFTLTQKLNFITPGLEFFGIFTTKRYSFFDVSRQYSPFFYEVGNYDIDKNSYTLRWINNQPNQAREYLDFAPGQRRVNTATYFQGSLSYDRTFGDHGVSAYFVGLRQESVDPAAVDPSTNSVTLQSTLPNRNLGFSGRVNYIFQRKYIAEFGFGYNGSEKFAPDHRWGFFPTVGATWHVARENFWKEGGIGDVINQLTLKATYGINGNDRIGRQRFFYLSNVVPNGGPSAVFGLTNSTLYNGTVINAYPNPDVTWETTRKTNLRLEIGLFKKLNITADVYKNHSYNSLVSRTNALPVNVGIENGALANLQANLGVTDSKGMELHIDYTEHFSNGITANVLGNFTLTSNKVVSTEEPGYRYAYSYRTGQPVGQPFGYIAERLFVDDNEVKNSAVQNFGGNTPVRAGDIKYRDINEDGIINTDDQVPLGLAGPYIGYGFGFTIGYKGLSLMTFFAGNARNTFFINPGSGNSGIAPFVNGSQVMQDIADNHWSPENQDLYAFWPRLSLTSMNGGNNNNLQPSSWWLRDGTFMRLKTARIMYELPTRFLSRFKCKGMSVSLDGQNLITWTGFKLWDPELGGNGFNYPIPRTYNMAINLTF